MLSKTRLAKRPKRQLDGRVQDLLEVPDTPLTPPPEEKEMVDLDLATEE